MRDLDKDNSSIAVGSKQTLYVGFGGHQVAVNSNANEVLEGIERSFREMLELEPKSLAGELEVRWDNGQYHLLGGSAASISKRVLTDVLYALKYEIVLLLIQSRPDLLWLHAGAAAHRANAIVIIGPSGRGKSTLVTSLCAQGWTYLSDDVIPLDPNSDKILPFLQTPWIREDVEQVLPLDKVRELKKTPVDLKREAMCRGAMPLCGLVFPIYSAQSAAKISPCSPATAASELLENCLNFVHHRQAAFDYICELVKHLPVFQLPYCNGKLAAELLHHTFAKGG